MPKYNELKSIKKSTVFPVQIFTNCQILKNSARTCTYSVPNLYRSATKYVRYRQTFTYTLKSKRTVTEPLLKKLLLAWHFVKNSCNNLHENSTNCLVADTRSDGQKDAVSTYSVLLLLVEYWITTKLKSKSSLIKIKQNMYSVWHNFLFILLFHMLATIFGLNRPSSGQIFTKT